MASQLKKTVKPSGGDYTSLEACMNANEQNLITADKYFDVEIDGTWSSADTTAVTIHNYTTDATRYINIYTTATARHQGKKSTSYYTLAPSSSGNAISVGATNLTFTGLQVGEYNTSGFNGGFKIQNGSNSTISKCIVFNNGSTGQYTFGIDDEWGGTTVIINSVIYGFNNTTGRALIVRSGGGNMTAYNCTVYGSKIGLARDLGTFLVKNIISYNNTTDYSGTFSSSSTNNLAKDTTTPEFNTYYDSKTLTFTDVANGDFHLVSGDTDAIDKGADLSAVFTDDIDGVTRTGTWDIGADEYVAAGGGWTHKIYGLENAAISKISGVSKADISKVNQT